MHLRSLNSEQCPLFFTQPTFLKKVGRKWEISESWRVLLNRWKHVCTDRKQTWADRNQSVMFRPDQKHLKSYQSVWTSILQILKLRLDVPPTGMRSLPVVKWSSFFCSSSGNASTTSQKNLLPPTQAQNTQIHIQTSCLWNGCVFVHSCSFMFPAWRNDVKKKDTKFNNFSKTNVRLQKQTSSENNRKCFSSWQIWIRQPHRAEIWEF